jgi:hypothetical protein
MKALPEKVLPLVVKRIFTNVIVPIWKKKVFRKQGGGAVLLLWPFNYPPLALRAKNEEIWRPITRKI